MTIISTFVTNDIAVAYSDGREVYEGKVTENKSDKTFTLYGNKTIGAYSGDYYVNKPDGSVVTFGKILAEYEKANPDAAYTDFVADNIETLRKYLTETRPKSDKLAFLHIVHQINQPDAKFHCYRYKFSTEEDGDKKKVIVTSCLDLKTNYCYSYDGDDLAVPIINKEFETNPPAGTKEEILDWCTKAFNKAIDGSTKMGSGETTCGGDHSHKLIG